MGNQFRFVITTLALYTATIASAEGISLKSFKCLAERQMAGGATIPAAAKKAGVGDQMALTFSSTTKVFRVFGLDGATFSVESRDSRSQTLPTKDTEHLAIYSPGAVTAIAPLGYFAIVHRDGGGFLELRYFSDSPGADEKEPIYYRLVCSG